MKRRFLNLLILCLSFIVSMVFFKNASFVLAEPQIAYDSIIQGTIENTSKNQVKLKKRGLVLLCPKFEIHNKKGNLIPSSNLILASKVKIYMKNGCGKRIDILDIQQ